MATLREDHGEWDWFGTMTYPPGPLREFDPDDWDASTTRERWQQFNDARKAAAPRGWRLAICRRMLQ